MQFTVRAAGAAMVIGAAALVTGCAQPGGTAAAARPAACSPLPAGSTTAELTLTTAAIGRTYCIRTGNMVRVLFFGLPQAWLPLRLTGAALVPVTEAGVTGPGKLMPIGPSDLYRAVHPGTATLTTSRLCAPLHPVSEAGTGSTRTSGCLGRTASFRVVIIVS